MKLSGNFRYFVIAGMFCIALTAQAEVFEVSAEQWSRPRSGERIIALAPLQNLVRYLDKKTTEVVVIRYAGGDEGLLWAEELRGWIIALGIPGNRVRLHAGLPDPDRLVLETE